MLCGYIYYRVAGNSAALASIGFPLLRRDRPARAGLFHRPRLAACDRPRRDGRHGRGLPRLDLHVARAFARQSGLIDGMLLLKGPFGIGWLRPEALFNIAFEPFTHGVFWSLTLNAVGPCSSSR